MFERIHSQFGTAGLVLSVVAIVLGLGGGAYAAKQAGLNKKQKKQVKNIAKKQAKKFAVRTFKALKRDPGDIGLVGPSGPQGIQGEKGDSGPPGGVASSQSAQVTRSTNFSFGDGAELAIPFDAENFDTNGFHVTSPGPCSTAPDTLNDSCRLVAPTAGLYLITATVNWEEGGGTRQIRIKQFDNGTVTAIVAGNTTFANPIGDDSTQSVTGITRMQASEYVTLDVFGTGDPRAVQEPYGISSGFNTPSFSILLLSS